MAKDEGCNGNKTFRYDELNIKYDKQLNKFILTLSERNSDLNHVENYLVNQYLEENAIVSDISDEVLFWLRSILTAE